MGTRSQNEALVRVQPQPGCRLRHATLLSSVYSSVGPRRTLFPLPARTAGAVREFRPWLACRLRYIHKPTGWGRAVAGSRDVWAADISGGWGILRIQLPWLKLFGLRYIIDVMCGLWVISSYGGSPSTAHIRFSGDQRTLVANEHCNRGREP